MNIELAKKLVWTRAFSTTFGIVVGNYLFAALIDRDWADAFKISYFQLAVVAWLTWAITRDFTGEQKG